ncbi:acyltransferase family protein [Rothia sp. ZJ1223]|uniref:acyltransferase family protein n=1 Tax=Rothia sp. ZJ1223 TaxID=2811098 RepID=UPI00195B4B7B|nr:acyltransferase family protein [Rothia sp. ZJ1223]MBM7051175.1 acyltransferase [Rothia sp. ZJ1223]
MTSPTTPKPTETVFRPEIQGLRALALTLVAAYHFWFGKVSGGVDVFLLISAFLMTGSFARKLERGEPVFVSAILSYWVRTFTRIVPLAAVTVMLVLAGTWIFLPQPRWNGIMDEAVATIFYRNNWWNIQNLTDYYAADSSEASPLRHFWSLSMQGQIFILWPLVFAGCWVLVRYLRLPVRPLLLTVFGIIFAVSLAYSVGLTGSDQQAAYFTTYARLWEFALGSLVAVALPFISAPRWLRLVMGWVGVVAIISCALVLDVEGRFPGFYALWPTLAAAFVMVGGNTHSVFGADRFLSHPALLWLAHYSYGLYLVHWPLLVFYLYTANLEKAGFWAGIALFAVSLGVSYLLTRLIETPIREWRWLNAAAYRGVAFVALVSCVVTGVVGAWSQHNHRVSEQLLARAELDNPGAQIFDVTYTYRGAENPGNLPLSVQRFDDRPLIDTRCDIAVSESYGLDSNNCHQIYTPEDEATQTVIAVGNSHMEQWIDNLHALAQQYHWNLRFLQYNDCYMFEPSANTGDPGCNKWIGPAKAFIDGEAPDAVVTVGTVSVRENAGEYLPSELEGYIQHVQAQGIELVALRDNPRFWVPHADCETRTDSLCEYDSELAASENPLQPLAEQYDNFSTVDMTDVICPEQKCPSTVGNVYTYRDDSHLTKTFTDSAHSIFSTRLLAALGMGASHL